MTRPPVEGECRAQWEVDLFAEIIGYALRQLVEGGRPQRNPDGSLDITALALVDANRDAWKRTLRDPAADQSAAILRRAGISVSRKTRRRR